MYDGVAGLIHVLISNAAVLVEDFVVPFGTRRKDGIQNFGFVDVDSIIEIQSIVYQYL